MWSLESRQGAEEITGHTALIRVAQELSVEVLVSGQGQTLALSNLVKCFVQNVHLRKNVIMNLDDKEDLHWGKPYG